MVKPMFFMLNITPLIPSILAVLERFNTARYIKDEYAEKIIRMVLHSRVFFVKPTTLPSKNQQVIETVTQNQWSIKSRTVEKEIKGMGFTWGKTEMVGIA